MEAAKRQAPDDAPAIEPMRAQRRGRTKPSREDLKIRRRQQRAQAPIPSRTASFWDQENIKPHERVTDWGKVVGDHDTSGWRIHRTVHLDPMAEDEHGGDGFQLWRAMSHDPVKGAALPKEEVAHRLMRLVTAHPHMGLHWTADERHAVRVGGNRNWGAGHSWYSGEGPGHQEDSGLSAPVIVHARWPETQHIETDPAILHRYGVKPLDKPELDEHDEAEVPMKHGAPIEITGLSWASHTSNRPNEYTHHTFDEPIRHTAVSRAIVLDCVACGHMSRYAAKRCRACGSLVIKTATVLMTQIERANPGDTMRTPQGQSVKIKQIRRHETDNGKVYVDTDLGTSIMNRGTDVNLTQGERQQELPSSGHPTGNTGELPGAGRTPTGEGDTAHQSATPQGAAPHCPRDGVRMVLRSNTWVCPIDGTTAPTSSAPAGMHPADRPSGYILQRERDGKIPQTHLWASYHTAGQPPAIVRRARQVLDTLEGTEEIRS
jgi:hypothetical protein